ncbi:MAG: hypothetical protein GY929_21930 [Actinomycetia bacterium]|nr:hypothetical protein [Actinomycetes bacterium]
MVSDNEPHAFERDLRRQQRDLEDDEIEFDWTTSSLDEALSEIGERGDTVRLSAAGHSWSGVLAHVGDDLATIITPAGVEIDVALARLESARVVERSRGPGRRMGGHPRMLEARLRELVVSGDTVELSVGDGLRGRLVAVAADHVRVEDGEGALWLVPTPTIAWVRRQP